MVHRKESSRAIIIVYGSLLLFLYLLCLAFPSLSSKLTVEDGPIEWLGALFLLGASILFIQRARFSYWYLLLALFCFLAFGEEISWGQRILDFQTPAFFSQWNVQKEINFHNLAWLSGYGKDGQKLPWWGNLLTAGRIFTLCCFTLGVFVPWGAHFSATFKEKMKGLQFPLLPREISYLFLGNFLLFRLSLLVQKNLVHDLNEVKESAYGLALLICAHILVKKEKTADPE